MKRQKLNKQDKELIKIAREVLIKARNIGNKKIGEVGCALITKNGNIYYGASADLNSALGTCAERAAIFNLLSNGENEIKTIVAVDSKIIYPPCGVCREMILAINKKNLNSEVIISEEEKINLDELLPNKWQEVVGEW